MRRINEGSDLSLKIGSSLTQLKDVRFYTRNKKNFIEKSSKEVKNGFINLTWTEMSVLEEGVLNIIYHLEISDSSFPDGKRDTFKEETAPYFIKTGIDGGEEKIARVAWGNIVGDITEQKDLSNELVKKQNAEQGKSLVDDAEISRLSTIHNYDDTDVQNRINDIETEMGAVSDILTRIEKNVSDDTLTNGGEIKNAGKFSRGGDWFYLTVIPKAQTNDYWAILKVKLKDSVSESEYPFNLAGTTPVKLESITITSQELQKYRFFWGYGENQNK